MSWTGNTTTSGSFHAEGYLGSLLSLLCSASVSFRCVLLTHFTAAGIDTQGTPNFSVNVFFGMLMMSRSVFSLLNQLDCGWL